MAEPTEKTIKQLFALSGNICAYPRCKLSIVESSGTVTGEICHIKARNIEGPRFDPSQSEEERHAFANLILLCRHHHKVIDSEPELYTADALQEMKSIHENLVGRKETDQDRFFAMILLNDFRRVSITNNSGNVAINSPGAIQGQTVNLKTTAKKVSVNTPPGSIGADQSMSRYVQYLIKRYNEFAGSDLGQKTQFSYGAISRNIEGNFGAPWKLLPIERAGEVITYLQGRIAKTRQARINKGNGYKSFSTYEEYIAKHGV
ncbi:MAG: HNH endonuclease [Nitrospira defluvii]|nr:HNH endonuclease [Nitrospira defluvii]